MNNYNQLIYKQLKVNKKRNIYTIVGIILAIVLFTTVGYLKIFMNKVNIEDAKIHIGNYEAYFYDMNKSNVKDIRNNVLIKDYGLAALESNEYINIQNVKKTLSIYALDNECINNIFNKSMVLEEGHFPENKGEVALDIVHKGQLNKNLGDAITVGENKYKIVGFFKGNNNNPYELNGITFYDNNNNYNNIITFINVKASKNINKTLLDIANNMKIRYWREVESNDEEGRLNLNENLISCYENSNILDFKNLNETKCAFLFIDLGIIALTIVLVLSSINISMKERIKYFSTLRCIGATPEKIRYLLLKESFVLGVLSIIPGLIIGYGVTYFIINIILKKIAGIGFYGVNFSVYWSVVISSVILVVLVILFSSLLPILKVGKISPIEAVKIGNFTLEKVKIRHGKIIRKIFGYKGVLAYKNIRANNRNFISTTLMLSVLLIALATFTGIYNVMSENIATEGNVSIKDCTIYINSNMFSAGENNSDSVKRIDDEFKKVESIKKMLKERGGIKNISSYMNASLDMFFSGIASNNNIQDRVEKDTTEVYKYTPNSIMLVYDNESIKEILPYIKSLTGKNISLEDFKHNDIVLIEPELRSRDFKIKELLKLVVNNENKVQMYLNSYSDSSQSNEDKHNKNFIDVNILGTIDSDNIIDGRNVGNFDGVTFIVSKDFYEKYKSLIFGEVQHTAGFFRINFDFLNKEERLKSLQYIKSYVNEIGGRYEDNYNFIKGEKAELLTLATIVYTIVFFTMAIGVVNIINNKNINILLRKKEIATMLAMGIRKKYLQKIIMLEGVIQWFISTVIATSVSCILLIGVNLIFLLLGENINGKSIVISIITFILGSIIFLIVNLISCKMALRNIEKLNIVKMLRSDG